MGLSIASPLSPERVKSLVIQSTQTYPAIDSFSWLDAQDRIIAATRTEILGVDLSDRPYFQEIDNRDPPHNLFDAQARVISITRPRSSPG